MNTPPRPAAAEGVSPISNRAAPSPAPATAFPMADPTTGRRAQWLRVLAFAGSLGALLLVFRRLDLAELGRALSQVHPGRYAAAVVLFGLGLVPSGFRWHQMLRLNRCEVTGATSVRMVFLSHFFSTVLFGPSSGDVPKTVLYCRWFGFRGSEVLAASMLDRLVAGAGGLLFIAAALTAAAYSGGLDFLSRLRLGPLPASWPWWLAGGAVGLGILAGWWRRRGTDSFARRTLGSLAGSLHRLSRCPVATARALGCSLLVVATLTAAQALCVSAASQTPLSLWNLAWGLHVATMIASLPITVAGIGLREGAYISLLALYGVTAPEAVAAALLALSLHILWAVVGFALWLQEQRLRNTAGAATARGVRIEVITADSRPQTDPSPADQPNTDTLAPETLWVFPRNGENLAEAEFEAIRRCTRDVTLLGGVVCVADSERPLWDAFRRLGKWFRVWLSGDLTVGGAVFVRANALRAAGWQPGEPLDQARWAVLGRLLRARGRLGLAVVSGGHGLRLEPGDVRLDAGDVGVRS